MSDVVVAPATPVTPNAQANAPANATDPNVGGEQAAEAVEYWEPDESLLTKRLKRKIDGEEREFLLKDAIEGYQLKEASNKRLREIAEERKQWARERAEREAYDAELAQTFRDPERYFEALLDADPRSAMEYVEKLHMRALQEAQLSPEQQKLRYYERLEAQRREEAAVQQQHQAYQAERNAWSKALQRAELPKDDPASRLAFHEAERWVQQLGRPAKSSEVAQFMRSRYEELTAASRDRLLRTLKAEDLPDEVRTAAAEAASKRAGERGQPVIAGVQPREPAGNRNGGQFKPAGPKVYDPFGS